MKQVIAERHGTKGWWSMAWLVKHLGRYPLRIVSVRLPHQQFKAEERRFEPPMDLNENDEIQFQVLVRCDETAGIVTENAFVIFDVSWAGEPWRIFVRLRVVVDSNGRPETATESITTQRVGFSGVST